MRVSRLLPLAFVLLTGIAKVPAAGLAPTTIMPLGDSITKGAVDPAPSLSGYRAHMFDKLKAAGVKYLFVGCTDNNSNDAMKAAGQQFHNGYGSWRIDQLRANFDANQPGGRGCDDNRGGFFLTGGTGALRQPVYPDIVLLLAGTNDLGQGASEPTLESRMTDLLGWFYKNRPKTRVFVGTVPPRGPSKPDYAPYNDRVRTFNQWIKNTVPKLSPNFKVVDIYGAFVDARGEIKTESSPDGIFLGDGIHPNHAGYVAMGDLWLAAIGSLLHR